MQAGLYMAENNNKKKREVGGDLTLRRVTFPELNSMLKKT